MTSSSLPAAPANTSDIYASVDNYPWDDDREFQAGLSAILGSNSSPEQTIELELRARCFYYSRKYNTNIDFDTYKAYRTAHSTSTNGTNTTATPLTTAPEVSTTPSTVAEPAAPYPTSFAHIVELITTGQPIPGIKNIPNTVLEGQGTEASRSRRKKPWEKDTESPAPATPGAATIDAPSA